MKERITKSSGNIFVDLGISMEEAAVLAMRAELMARLRSVTSCAASGISSAWKCWSCSLRGRGRSLIWC